MQGICKLCGQQKELQYSHIVPAFAVRWLKATSLTGYLKGFNSKVRQQETKRVYLLCSDCEQLLSKDEKVFCEKIFIPYHEQNQSVFNYGPWLKRFIIGLHWKVLVTKEEQYPEHAEAAYAKAEPAWRQFLLGQSASHGDAEFHLFLADVVQDASDQLPEKMNWYLARGFDFTPLYSDTGMAGAYAKVIKIVTFSYLAPGGAKDKLHGTLVQDEGVIGTGQQIQGDQLAPFLLDRARAIERLPKTISARQHQKLMERARLEPERLLQAESLRTFEADMALKERQGHRMRERLIKREAKRRMKGRDRNSPCPCGSGIKYKKCHG